MSKSRYQKLNDEEWLREQYINKCLSGNEIAAIVGCRNEAVYRALRSFDIDARVGGNGGVLAKDYPELRNKTWLEKEYVANKRTVRSIANELGCSTAIVLKSLEFFGITRRRVTVKRELLKDETWLRSQYVDLRRSAESMAEEIACSKHAIYRALKRFRIDRRPHTSKYEVLNDKDWLYEQYVTNQRSLKDIAKEIGTTVGNVADHLSAMEIRLRGYKESIAVKFPDGRLGDKSPKWKGGRRSNGKYILVYAPDHPYATTNGAVLEHRLVMEKVLGRYLEPYEVVHHKDGNKKNNDPSNLEVKTSSQHIKDHIRAGHDAEKLRARVAELEAEIERLKQDNNAF